VKGETILNALETLISDYEGERLGTKYQTFHDGLARRLRAWDFVQQKFPGVAMTCLDVLAERERGK
jgi:hypothetical protein